MSDAFPAVLLSGLMLVMVGCNGDPRSRRDCTTAATKIVNIAIDELPEGVSADRDRVAGFERALTTACVEDRWSAAAVDCVAAARNRTTVRRCERYFTAEQEAGIAGELLELVAELVGD